MRLSTTSSSVSAPPTPMAPITWLRGRLRVQNATAGTNREHASNTSFARRGQRQLQRNAHRRSIADTSYRDRHVFGLYLGGEGACSSASLSMHPEKASPSTSPSDASAVATPPG